MLVHILPTGSGNISSLAGAMSELGNTVANFQDELDINKVRKVLIPGVGSFALAMDYLRAHGLVQKTKEYVESGGQVLGICLGMQILAEKGLEHGEHLGFGFIGGAVLPFRGNTDGNVSETHVGFNNLEITNSESNLLRGVSSMEDFYFTHSFFLSPVSSSHVAALSHNGVSIAAVIDKNNQIFGTQFHPEKSQHQGLRILKNFVDA